MKIKTLVPTFKKATAASIAAALVLTSFGPAATSALAQEFQAPAGRSAPLQVSPVMVLGGLNSPLNQVQGSGLAAPRFQGGLPSLSSPSPKVKAQTAAAAPAVHAPASAPEAAQKNFSVFSALKQGLAGPKASGEETPSIPKELVTPSREAMSSNASAKGWAERSFRFLKGESAEADASGVKAEALAAKPSGLRRWAKPAGLAVLGTSLLGFAANAESTVKPAVAAAVPAAQPGLLASLGSAGHFIGNGLAFVFPLFQIRKTFADGHAKNTPMVPTLLLATASLALGLVSATLKGDWFWGVQNIFGGLASLAVIPLGRWLEKRDVNVPGFSGLAQKAPWRATAVAAALVGLVSFALYFAAAPVVPLLLAKVFTAAGLSNLKLGIQIVTGAMYLAMFYPAIKSLITGKAAQGFTPGFSMTFFICSTAFVVWLIQESIFAPAGSKERLQYTIYAVLNVAYAIVALGSFFMGRKAEAKPAPLPRELPNPPPLAQAAPQAPAGPREAPGAFARKEGPILPADAEAMTADSLLKAKAAAQLRARAIAKDARLVKVTINLDDPRAHWTFVFHSNSKKKVLTVWQKRIALSPLSKKAPKTQAIWDTRLAKLSDLKTAAAQLKDFKAVRVEIKPQWKDDPIFVFIDEAGRTVSVPGTVQAVPEVPKPEEPAKPLPPPQQLPQPPPAAKHKWLHENLLGFRRVQGLKYDQTLPPLPADAQVPRIIDQLAKQFNIPRAKVLELAAGQQLYEHSPREAWLAVYDRMQKANRQHFKMFDQKKYHGWSSFRELANKNYPAGWPGVLLRASEVHKHFLGFFVRLPYHLFDMFLFGYFRTNISFEFRHSAEDFLNVEKAGKAEDFLKAALRRQGFQGSGFLGGLKANPAWRVFSRYVLTPVVEPLGTFIARRVTLAVMSAVAMGLMGAFAPGIAIMSFSLTAIPVLGPALVGAAHGLPFAVGAVPFIGHFLAPVIGAAMSALLRDMVVGPLLQTLLLSTLLTFPRAVGERVFKIRNDNPGMPFSYASPEFLGAVLKTAFSWSFWSQNGKSFVGMVTVGAEIEGIMTYAGGLDAAVSVPYHAVTGHDFKVFEAIGAAVERPAGDSPIPFGGAITWGNVLLYKAQNLLGFNLSDWVMHTAVGVKGAVSEKAIDPALAGLSAQAVVHAAVTRADAPKYEFDPELYKKDPAEVAARVKDLAGKAGGLQEEMRQVRLHSDKLLQELARTQARIAQLEKESRPITPEERAEYDRILKELTSKRSEAYIQSKLSELADLKSPNPEALERLRYILKLQQYYDAKLIPPTENPGQKDDLAVAESGLKAMLEHFSSAAEGRTTRHGGSAAAKVDQPTLDKINALIGEIEELRGQARAEMANRDAAKKLLALENSERNRALRDRRGGKDMLSFHKNVARLATVMDLALSLNEIAAAEAAIKQMQSLLDKKIAKIQGSQASNQQNQAAADADKAKIDQWKAEAQKTLDADIAQAKDLAEFEAQAGMAVTRIGAFKTDVSAIIAQINAQDGGKSGDAAAEYQRRLDLLPTVVDWRTNGNPNDSNAFSLKQMQSYLRELADMIPQAEDGINQLAGAPLEFAGLAIIAVPGPKVNVTSPSQGQVLQILSERRTYWENRRVEVQKALDGVNRRLDPANSGTLTDEFGDSAPESLPIYRAQQVGVLAASQANAQQFTGQIDALAAQVNAVTGAGLPPLSGQSLTGLQDSFKTYGDKLKAIKFPAGETPELHLAQMNLISIIKLMPYAGRELIKWSKADGTIKTIDDAMTNVLPLTVTRVTAVAKMLEAVVADVDKDVAYMNNGGDPQALLNRKISLLRDTSLPAMRGAADLLQNTLIPFQQKTIDSAKPHTGDFFKLFDAQKTLITQTKDLYDAQLPWALASNGAPQGDSAGGRARIAERRAQYQKNLDGYTDDQGVRHQGINEADLEIQQRKDPNFAGTETLYGEVQPFSLPRKISQYSAERAQRAAQLNSQGAQINEIVGKIQALAKGRYNLAPYALPANVTADKSGAAAVQALVDNNTIRNLADKLKEIGTWADAQGGAISIGDPNSDTPPTGNQPPITLNEYQSMALLSLDAVKRLVPTSLDQPQSAPEAYAVARFLYSDGVINAATDGLNIQVPKAEAFVAHGKTALAAAIADTYKNEAYVSSNGTGETADQVYAREVAVYGQLDDFLKDGLAFFGLKQQWDRDAFASIDKIGDYYGSLHDIYNGGSTANDSELTAARKMKDALQSTFNSLETSRQKVSGWMAQLNDPHDSALRRINEDLAALQEKTRKVLEENVKYHDLNRQVSRSEDILRAQVIGIQEKQEELKKIAVAASKKDGLPPELVARIDALKLYRGSWAMDSESQNRQAQTLVIKKSEYAAFLDVLLGLFKAQDPTQDLSQIKSDLLGNPQGLTRLIPDAQMLDFGDTADGFYMVYQSQFSVPHGLETSNWVTLGNIGKVWGNNVSVNGYAFGTPSNVENAGYGDKGVEVQLESLQGDHVVNYLNVDFHRVGTEAPVDDQFVSTTKQSRLMIFDDYAMMLMGDRLYVGLTGFADLPMSDAKNKPSYYGGNLKTSLKLTEVMSLNAEQQEMFANDPRTFMQKVNLDFTGYDPDLNRDWTIEAKGDNKHYSRTQLGPSFNIAKLLESNDAFTVDLFYAKSGGTDDIAQQSLGATVLKGFTIRDDSGKPMVQITNRTTGELGQQFNTLTDKLSVTLPEHGIVISGQGQILGTASAYYGEVAKKMGTNSNISLGYGAPYVGMNNRLTLSMNSSFTLGELWSAVVTNSANTLQGGETLRAFNKDMDEFFKGDGKPTKTMSELKQVFEQDVARKLLSQDIGTITKEINELRKAGAFMDNTRMRGMVGFVSQPISNDKAELATGGGFATGVNTDMTLTKTQKALIEAKSKVLYREGLRLQGRLLELTKQWQGAVTALAQAQWDLKMARFIALNSPTAALRQEGEVKTAEASERLHEALLRYNVLSGRNPGDALPFDNLSSGDLEELMAQIQKTIAAPERLTELLHSLDQEDLKAALGENPFNLLDWIPWVDKLTVSVGVQFQDLLANQQFGVGGSVRLPVYNPKDERDHAYRLESRAAEAEMQQAFADFRLRADKELSEAQALKQSADAVRPGVKPAAAELANAIRAYRNGLIGAAELREAFANWSWYAGTALDSDSKAALALAWSSVDESFVRSPERDPRTVKITALEDAFKLIKSQSLQEVALRQQAAAAMTQANDRRIQKAFVDLFVGANLTVTGLGWLPAAGITGIPVVPVIGFELKPQELMELQVKQGQGQTEYYAQLKAKLEAGLALEFYQNLMAAHVSQLGAATLETKVLPELEAALADAQSRGASQTEVLAASKKLDGAKLRLDQARLAGEQAKATLNYLLGRSADSPLDISLGSDEALASIERLMAASKPVETQKKLLASRVEVAQAVEKMVDKNLKVEQLYLEPISLSVRSLGRLIAALSGDGISNPDLAAAARVQTLTEQRAQDNFGKELQVQAARSQAQLLAAQKALGDLAGKTDAESELQRLALAGKVYALKANLAAMAQEADQAAPEPEALPATFAELGRRLAQKHQVLTNQAPEEAVTLIEPETVAHQAEGFARYYHAVQTLSKAPINKDFIEGWVEIRLKSQDTPPETLLALSQLRMAKADRQYRNIQEGAAAKAEILTARFAADVQLLRWAMAKGDGALVKAQTAKLNPQKDEISALLNLAPETTLGQLADLVPENASGSNDLRAIAQGLIDGIRAKQFDRIKSTLFDGGLPAAFGSEDGLINQIRANTIAERMSYKGFTPVAAFGIFRDVQMGGGFLEAPDPRAIQSGLENVVSDVLRKELESTGRLQELTLKLHLEMSRVEDGEKLIEERWRNIQAAEADYRSRMGLAGKDAGAPEVVAAQERLVLAWTQFTDQMIKTKGDFITLVTELEAMGEGKPSPIKRTSSPVEMDWSGLHRDPTAELLSYWSERVLDPAFASAQDELLESLGPSVTAEMKEALREHVAVYQRAKDNEDGVRHAGFAAAEKLSLLTKVDLEGRRLDVSADLAGILRAAGLLNPKLVSFLTGDLKARLASKQIERGAYEKNLAAMREAYWRAVPAPFGSDGAFTRLEALDKELSGARQSLLDSYLRDVDDNPGNFVLKDVTLDNYLTAQRRFDDELIKTLDAPEVQGDARLVKTLNGLYDIAEVFKRTIDAARSGRAMAAIDALIMLEDARLAGARWARKAPEELGRIAGALESLKATKDRWAKGTASLEPLFAVTKVTSDGKRLWTIEDWLTKAEVDAKRQGGLLDETDANHIKIKGTDFEIVGGVDIAEAAKTDAQAQKALNDQAVKLHERMRDNEFVLVDSAIDSPLSSAADGAAPSNTEAGGRREGYTYAELFAPGALMSQGRVLFFDAPKGGVDMNNLHKAVPALTGLRRAPEENAMYVYTGKAPLGRDRFPTLESLLGSREIADFHRVEMSAKGAGTYAERAYALRDQEARQGFVELKLNGFGFARDAKGEVVELYQTEKAFDAAKDGFLHAGKLLNAARQELAAAQKHAEEAKALADKAKAVADRAGLKYQETRARISKEILESLKGDMPREDGESEQIYQARVKMALDRELAQDNEFKAAQKEFDPAAKDFTKAAADYKEAAAKVKIAEKGVEAAEKNLERSKEWSLYASKDVSLKLDHDKAVVRVLASPVFGGLPLDEKLPGGAEETTVAGELYAAELDNAGHIVAAFTSAGQVEKAAQGWSIKSVTLGGDKTETSGDGKTLNPTYRLSHYEDGATNLPVMLNRRYLIEMAESAKSKADSDPNWGLKPWNWGNLILELPRGLINTPTELIFGRDQTQEHYLGRVNMYKMEGGETEHHGFFRKVLGVIDVLDFLPDHVERYFDPSQFPQSVSVDSRVLPGENVFDKDMRDAVGSRNDIHMGAKAARRIMTHSLEDLTNSRNMTLARFQGGVEKTILETRRGRGGIYGESKKTSAFGDEAVGKSLEDPLIAGVVGADGQVILSANPGNIEVNQVESRVRIRPGALQYSQQAGAVDGYAERMGKARQNAAIQDPILQKALEDAKRDFDSRFAARREVDQREAALWNEFHKISWRIGEQEALEREIGRLKARVGELKSQLAWWGKYLKQLEEALRKQPRNPNDPTDPNDPSHWPLPWIFLCWLIAALIALLWWWLHPRPRLP